MQEWPGLGFGTYFLLQRIREKYGRRLVENVAERILWEVQQAKKQS
jgi:hypothetical protein